MVKLFDAPQTIDKVRYISHRGFQPMAPANSKASFRYAGMLKQWAIETDVRFTKDGIAVCCHDAEVDALFDGNGVIADTEWNTLSHMQMKTGNRVAALSDEDKQMPLFSEYLAICKTHNSIPFIELKTPDTEQVIRLIRNNGFEDAGVVISSSCLDWLIETRKLAPDMFIHWIFGNKERLDELAALGNAGMSWRIDDPMARPVELIQLSHQVGLKVCLRAADSMQSLQTMLSLGLDYIPTNCMHNPF